LENPGASAAQKVEKKAAQPPPFARERDPVLRRGLYEKWKAERSRAAAPLTARKIAAPLVTSTVGRPSMAVNASGTTLFTKQFPPSTCDVNPGSCGPPDGTSCTQWTATTAFASGKVVRAFTFQMYSILFQAQNAGTTGASEPLWPTVAGGSVVDGTITWLAIGYDPAMFTGCTAMQLISRSSVGVETVLASEGDNIAGGQLSGWGEFVAFNDSGIAAFKSAQAGVLTNSDEGSVGVFKAGPGAGALSRIAQFGDVIGGRKIYGISPMVAINNSGQVLFDGYAGIARPTWQANTLFNSGTVIPTVPGLLEFFVSTPGTSGAVEPVWPTIPNQSITDGTAVWRGRVRDGNEDDHGIIRFTSGPGNELLLATGQSVGGGFVVQGFGELACGACQYDNIDPFLNALGHTSTAVTLTVPQFNSTATGARKKGEFSNITAAYLLTGPAAFTQVARTGTPGPGGTFDVIHSRTTLNNCDQVVFKASIVDSVDKVIRWTPPSTYAVVASVNDDLGLRSGGGASGVTIVSLGDFFDINNLGNVVFQAIVNVAGINRQSYLFWDGTTGFLSEIVREPTLPVNFASEMITLNDCNTVAFTSGALANEAPGEGSELDEKGLHTWTKLGGVVDVIKVGDVIGGDTVSSVNAQHHSFARRQLGPSGCIAVNYFVNGVTGGFTEDAGEGSGTSGVNGGVPPAGQLFVSCPQVPCQGLTCGIGPPTPTITPTGTQTQTPTPTASRTPTQQGGAAVQVPMLNGWALAFLGLLLAAAGLLFVRSR
jgi:hypothetical protein